ncbi:ribonuclease T [Luteimonas granuli]|uniref:Ribonuclease T n=2 Tax=Luteimonas granuli TaxID=1176533 RepID=A0A518N1E1_9GAMM|nr:ribonuclease T [Luteimonas granuli]
MAAQARAAHSDRLAPVTIQPAPVPPPAAPAFTPMSARFRGYLPVVVDVETGGFDWNRHALLEIAVLPIDLDADGRYVPGEGASAHLVPAPGTEIDPKSLQITGIDLGHPFRFAKPEREALEHVFAAVRVAVRKHGCQRAILVGHNAHFDLNFLNAAVARSGHKRNPFHPFSVFDTVTMAGLAYGQTVLARAVQAAGLEWNSDDAHSAVYDTERTAQLFCTIANAWGRFATPPA